MLDELSISPCNLCPRLCGAKRLDGKRGACGADNVMRVARAALHFWEEPPLSGESGSGAVFFAGCPLHCVYCQNATIAAGDFGKEVSVERLAEICLELEAKGALNINFVTPTHYSLQILEAVKRARERGLSLPIVWNTSGYERVETVRALEGAVDVYLADFKYADVELSTRYSNAPDYAEVALEAIATMVEQIGDARYDEVPGDDGPQIRMTRGVIVRHLQLPGALDASKQALVLLYDRFGDSVLYSIMNQYTPVIAGKTLERYSELGTRVPDFEYEELLEYADDLGIQDYFWQEGPTAEESFIPAWDCEGV